MIPPFNSSGLLPPFNGPGPHVGSSPYSTDPFELVQRFGTTAERINLLLGFMEYRRELRVLGVQGIQFINGSFCEDIEATEGRAPGDVDVVTFLGRPPAHAQPAQWHALVSANPALFCAPVVKAKYSCDAYVVDVSFGPETVIEQTMYWMGLFTHRKVSYEWKGALVLHLGTDAYDDQALDYLVSLRMAS